MTEPRTHLEKEDYIFRYRLRSEGEETDGPFYEDRLLEMIRQQLANLLDVVVLTHRGEEVKVDGFKLLSDLDCAYEIFPREEHWRQRT